jgi:hypothetical protein
MFAELPPDQAEEAGAVLDALPAAMADAILGAVRSGLSRRLPVRAKWELGNTFEVRVSETKTRVRIVIVTPDGQRYVRAARRQNRPPARGTRSAGGRTRRTR